MDILLSDIEAFVLFVLHFRSKRLGWVLKIALLVSLPVPLTLWPIVAIIGSLIGGIGYGFLAPLIATFEAIGESITSKIYHCFAVSLGLHANPVFHLSNV